MWRILVVRLWENVGNVAHTDGPRFTVGHAFVRLRIINFGSERGNQAGIQGGVWSCW